MMPIVKYFQKKSFTIKEIDSWLASECTSSFVRTLVSLMITVVDEIKDHGDDGDGDTLQR